MALGKNLKRDSTPFQGFYNPEIGLETLREISPASNWVPMD